jgi:peptidyl-prolyl cis-trans isomerase B (cyclophilin B)
MKKYLAIALGASLFLAVGCNGADADVPDTITGTIEMEDGGIMTFELYHNIAPQSVRNFVYLARQGFYDGLKFHRIMEGFMIQGGCPNGAGNGNPGHFIFGEFDANGFENNLRHERGVMSMARRGDDMNSAGSQFFICHADRFHLDGDYAAFGRIIDGMDIVDEIAKTPVIGNNGQVLPEDMPVIKTITIDYEGNVPAPNKR